MSTFNLAKKLKPAKKAWKSFTIQLKSKFKNFSVSKTIKNTKKQFISALHTVHCLIPQKILNWTRSRRRCRYHLYHHHRCRSSPMKSFKKTVHVDEFFPKNSFDDQPKIVSKEASSIASSSFSISLSNNVEKNEQVYYNTSKNALSIKGVKILENKKGETSKSVAEEDGLKLSLLSKFRGIDERADEFISKFKEDMKLESEKSILDYQEMLARSV